MPLTRPAASDTLGTTGVFLDVVLDEYADQIEANQSAITAVTTTANAAMPKAGGTFTGDVVVPDEVYDATAWNGSLEVPTKNAVRDKIEALSVGAGVGDLTDCQFSRVTANQSVTSSTTPVNITDLVEAMGANQTWVFRLALFVVGNSTGDFRLAFTVPAGATILGAAPNGATGATDPGTGSGTIYASASFASSGASDVYGASTLPFLIEATVIVRTGATTGNFQPQFAQGTSNATATTVKLDSFMISERYV